MSLLRFLKLPCKTERKYELIFVILLFNLLVGFICLRSWKSSPFIIGQINASSSSSGGRILQLILPQWIYRTSMFPNPSKFIIPNSDFCSNWSNLILLILVCTSTDNFLQRQTIRETWGSVAALNKNTGTIRIAFLLGKTSNSTVQQKIIDESTAHSDIIQGDFVDSYKNLTLKSIMLLKWTTTFCPNVQFVLKTDDDMYINTDNLIKTFTKLPHSNNVMYGVLFQQAKPIRDVSSKWFVPEAQFKGEFFPDYLSGTSYVISGDAVPKLLKASYDVPFLVLEDVFITGLCAEKAGVELIGIQGFNYQALSPTGCSFRDVISGHHVTPSEMRTIWTELHNKNLMCGNPELKSKNPKTLYTKKRKRRRL